MGNLPVRLWDTGILLTLNTQQLQSKGANIVLATRREGGGETKARGYEILSNIPSATLSGHVSFLSNKSFRTFTILFFAIRLFSN